MRSRSSQSILAGVLIAAPAVLAAQEATQSSLEEVVVSAQKRDLGVQDIPTTVSVVDGATLATFGVADFDDLDSFVPGLVFTRQPGNNFSLTIRGIGSSAGQQAFEQSVVSYIDGVYGGYQKDFSISLFDLERAEILKGTQSGILGKNASVGAINIITRKPGAVLGGYLNAGYEIENGSKLYEGAVDIPATDSFRVRFAGRYEDTDGFMQSLITGEDVQQIEQKTARVNAVWEATENVTAKLFAQYDDQDKLGDPSTAVSDTATGTLVALDPRFRPGANAETLHFTSRGKNGEPYSALEAKRASLTVDVGVGSHTLTSVTGFSDNSDEFVLDLDYYLLDGSSFVQTADFSQFTQEVRIASDSDRRLSYILGVFYYTLEWDRVFQSINDRDTRSPFFTIPVSRIATIPYRVKTDGVSGFGQLEYKLTDLLKVGATVRATNEDKEVRIQSISNFPAGLTSVPLTTEKRSSDPVDGSVNLNFNATDDFMLYALASRGTKTGAFADVTNNVSINPQTGRPSNEVADEIATTYELGAKTSFLNKAANLNVSIWHMDVKDFQESIVVGGVFLTANQDYVSDGAELQGSWAATSSLRLSGTATYVDARNETPPAFAPPVTPREDIPALRAPKWTVNADARYQLPLGGDGLTWTAAAHMYYRTKYYNAPLISLVNYRSYSDAVTRFDLDLSLRHDNGWGLSLAAKNLANRDYCDHGTLTNFLGADNQRVCFQAPTRTVMVQASYDF